MATINLAPRGQFANLSEITFPNIIKALVTLMLVIAALIFFFMLVLGGIEYISSGGDKGRTEAPRGRITAALIGLFIVFGAWAILSLVRAFFGIDIFHLNLNGALNLG